MRMNWRFYQNIELTCTAIASRYSFWIQFWCSTFFQGKVDRVFWWTWSVTSSKVGALKNLTLSAKVVLSKIATSTFHIPYFLPNNISVHICLPQVCFEIPAKGWICFWKSISFPLRFFWLFSRELLFFGNILLLFSFHNNAAGSNQTSYQDIFDQTDLGATWCRYI